MATSVLVGERGLDPRRLMLASAVAGLAASLVLASFLLIRALAGGLLPMATGDLLLLAGGAVLLTLSGRLLALRSRVWLTGLYFFVVPAAILWLFVIALTLPQGARPGTLVLWLLAIVEELFCWLVLFPRWRTLERAARGPQLQSADVAHTGAVDAGGVDEGAGLDRDVLVPSGMGEPRDAKSAGVSESDESEMPLPPGTTLQLTRHRGDAGEEILYGRLRGEFAPAARTGILHLAFCPPFPVTPQLQVHQIEGPPARTKVALLEAYGARIEVRLAQKAAVETSVVLEFFAQA